MFCFLWSKQAMAHDPGLSTVEIRVAQSAGVTLEMAMAPSDIQRICNVDTDGDQRISATEFENAKSCLLNTAASVTELRFDGQQLTVVDENATYDEKSSVVVLRLRFGERVGNHFELRSGIIHSMARGHRQFVTLKGHEGQIIAERMLDATDDKLIEDLSAQTNANASFTGFLLLGIQHILTGYDHLAFLFALLLAGSSFRSAGKVISAFTIAHSITLALATFGLLQIPSRIVEPLIAASIVYVGVENLRHSEHRARWLLTFGFGLVHGLGFASVLRELGISQTGSGALVPLLSFNMGVEIGQLAIAALVLPVIWKLKKRPEFDLRYVPACSAAIAIVGCFWLFQRTVM
jgi:hydrogenase/urease accessory protein HupE